MLVRQGFVGYSLKSLSALEEIQNEGEGEEQNDPGQPTLR